MAKYKIGDRVRVRSDLEPRTRYGKDTFVEDMTPCLGKIVTIKKVRHDDKYLLEEDLSCCMWTNEMLLGLEDAIDVEILDETITLKIGDKVTVRQDLDTSMNFQGWNITQSMMKYANKEVTISLVGSDSDGVYYEIDEDRGVSNWTNHMFSVIKPKRSINANGIIKALKNFSDEQLEQELERRKKEI